MHNLNKNIRFLNKRLSKNIYRLVLVVLEPIKETQSTHSFSCILTSITFKVYIINFWVEHILAWFKDNLSIVIDSESNFWHAVVIRSTAFAKESHLVGTYVANVLNKTVVQEVEVG